MGYTAEINGTGLRKVQSGMSRSTGEWIRGIRSGRLEKKINTYYDQVKELDPENLNDVRFDDP